ncbi:MAG TPA: hypothetical protein VLG50_08175 [Candidatus Saccharimonadales bacterium]|nr:hypothetical protein [Candidatus Saccharimonadales bacterium]
MNDIEQNYLMQRNDDPWIKIWFLLNADDIMPLWQTYNIFHYGNEKCQFTSYPLMGICHYCKQCYRVICCNLDDFDSICLNCLNHCVHKAKQMIYNFNLLKCQFYLFNVFLFNDELINDVKKVIGLMMVHCI